MPIIYTAAMRAVAELLTRECPQCHKRQPVPQAKIKSTISCRHCGAEVPPRKK